MLVLSLLLITILGCWGILGPQECMGVGGSYSSTIKMSIRDKQTDLPVQNAKINIVRNFFYHAEANSSCDKYNKVVETIDHQTDASGLFSFSYSYTTYYSNDQMLLHIKVTNTQYEPLDVTFEPKPGINEINLRMLSNLNQP